MASLRSITSSARPRDRLADAGPIVRVRLIGLIDLQPALYGLPPGLVYQDVVGEGKDIPGCAELGGAGWADRVDPDNGSDLFGVLRAYLDPPPYLLLEPGNRVHVNWTKEWRRTGPARLQSIRDAKRIR